MFINYCVEFVEGDDIVEDFCDGVDRNVLEVFCVYVEVL